MKRVETTPETPAIPVVELTSPNSELKSQVKFSVLGEDELSAVAALRAASDPWKSRGETPEEALAALTKLRPFVQVAKLQGQLAGYVTIERDGPVPGAAYMRNILIRSELRRRGLGKLLLDHAIKTAGDMFRKTLALRVDPSNAAAVSFYRAMGFTTVGTVVSKKSGKLRLLMSREL